MTFLGAIFYFWFTALRASLAHKALGGSNPGILRGSDLAKTVVEFARGNQVTQIFVAHSEIGLLERLRGRNFTEDIVRLAQDLQATVVADRSRRPGA